MKLQILVNHYKESEEIVTRFLDSLSSQKDVDFEVFIGSDGGDVKISEEILKKYDFKIFYYYFPHSGVCHTRNVLFDLSSAKYIMFCDIDDMFSSSDGLSSLLKAAEHDADVVGSPYQTEYPNGDVFKYTTLNEDIIRLHGKIFRREYIVANAIRFPDDMKTSGDMMFLWLAYALTNKIVWIKNNFYIWKWNDESVTRKNPLHSILVYPQTLKCYCHLADELKKRNRPKLLQNLISTLFGMVYIDSTAPMWNDTPSEYRADFDAAIKDYVSNYYEFYSTINEDYRRNKYELMLNYRNAAGIAGKFEDLDAWAQGLLSTSTSEILSSNSDVLIIGYGIVGHNLEKELAKLEPAIYDKYKGIDTRESGKQYKVAFICVNTPLTEQSLCDHTEVRNAINENNALVYVIKSTILPGTTDQLCKETGRRIVFSPEYYGETQHNLNYMFDYTILGGYRPSCIAVIQILQQVYDGRHQFRVTDAKTAELVKYMENSFLATKVSFCQQFYNIAEKIGVSYEELRELFILDPRVNPSHTFVYRDKPYWDSMCLNKDVPAIAETYDATLLKNVIEFNEQQKPK